MRFMARSLIHEDSIFNIGIIREIQPHMIPWPTHCHVLSDWHQWRLNNAQYHSHPSTLSSSTLDNANVSRSSSVVKKFKTSLLVENRSHRRLNPYLIFRSWLACLSWIQLRCPSIARRGISPSAGGSFWRVHHCWMWTKVWMKDTLGWWLRRWGILFGILIFKLSCIPPKPSRVRIS